MAHVKGASSLPHPAAPTTLDETGLTLDLILQLVLKTLHFHGELDGTELARRLGLSFPVIEPAIDMLKAHQHCVIAGGGVIGSASYRYRITDAGRTRAALFLESNQYVGVAPVPLDQFCRYMTALGKVWRPKATHAGVRSPLSHLVLNDRVLDQLGPAISAGHSLFIYGPPGNGKTMIAQSIRNMLTGEMVIPHAVEVEGSLIRVFDPVNHEAVASNDADTGLAGGPREDRRWIRCRRPLVTVGGELTLDALDLYYSPQTGVYRAPVQAVANGGVLVIDDFGRQRCSPRELLNRWIVPLENRVDYLTLQSGQKFEIPLMVFMVFATNVKPADLVDEAFLRRIRYKVFADNPTPNEFERIFENYCREQEVPFDRSLVEYLVREFYRPRQLPLRGCHPRDLIDQALSLADYFDEPRRLTRELLEAACTSCFVDDHESAATHEVDDRASSPAWA